MHNAKSAMTTQANESRSRPFGGRQRVAGGVVGCFDDEDTVANSM